MSFAGVLKENKQKKQTMPRITQKLNHIETKLVKEERENNVRYITENIRGHSFYRLEALILCFQKVLILAGRL